MSLENKNSDTLQWVEETIQSLQSYCLKRNFNGADPYDGLESRLFKRIPGIRSSRICRLAWIQLFKKNPLNLRYLTGVPELPNAKTYALFLKTYCLQYKMNANAELLDKIHFFIRELKHMVCKGYHGACWGYPFDWQSRSFFLRAYTPTAVCTAFVTDALLDAYEIVKEEDLYNLLLTVPEFYLKDIHRREYNGKYCSISYSPADYEEVYNVSYLVAASLARLHDLQPTPEWKTFASRLVRFGADQQKANGLWNYGSASHHQWADGFHTGFNLVSLQRYITLLNDKSQRLVMEKGFDCFIKTFTDVGGDVFYYSNGCGPLDSHNVAQALITIIELGKWKDYRSLIYKIFRKSMKYLYDERGFFYFQKYKYYTNKISYMRWSQAWMLLALTMLTYEWKKNENLV